MVSKNTVLISVSKDTKVNLDKLKLHPSLSYNDVIVELVDFWKMNNPLYVDKEENQKSVDIEIPIIATTDFSTGN